MTVPVLRFGVAVGVVSLALAIEANLAHALSSPMGVVSLALVVAHDLGIFGVSFPLNPAGASLLPPAFAGAFVAFVLGARRLATTTICLCIGVPIFISISVAATYPWDMILLFVPLAVALSLGAWLMVGYLRAKAGKVARPLPRWLLAIRDQLGPAVGVVSLALAVAANLVGWGAFTPGLVLLAPAFAGALVAFAHGAWRLAATTICLCLGAAVVIPISFAATHPWDMILLPVPLAVALGLGAWFMVDYLRTRADKIARPLPRRLLAIRDRLGMVVGAVSLAMALLSWFFLWSMMRRVPFADIWVENVTDYLIGVSGDESDVYLDVVYVAYMALLACLGAVTALACGARRTAALAVYFSITYLGSLNYPFPGQLFAQLVGGAIVTVCLIWNYRQSKKHA